MGNKKVFLFLLFFLATNLFSIFVARNQLLSLLIFLRMVELFGLYLLIVNNVLKRDELIKVFIFSVLFQSGLAIIQYFRQGSVGLHMLGESAIGPEIPGIAKVQLAGQKLIRAYGTFSHPNVLAGAIFMALGFCAIFFKGLLKYLTAAVLFIAFIFTFSRSALLAFILAAIICFFALIKEKKRFLKYLLVLIAIGAGLLTFLNLQNIFWQRFVLGNDGDATNERITLLKISSQMLINHPFGVGAGGFTLNMQNNADFKLAPWIYQPVHNTFMLAANELGVIGAVVLLAVFVNLFVGFYKVFKQNQKKRNSQVFKLNLLFLTILVGIFVIANFDHYFLTIYQGQILLFLFLGIASQFLEERRVTS